MSSSKNSMVFLLLVLLLGISSIAVGEAEYWEEPADGVFHSADEIEQGSGSGLNADTLDGHDSSYFKKLSDSGSISASAPVFLASGHIIAEESFTLITDDGSGELKVDNKFDEKFNDQRAFVIPGSMPGTPPDGMKVRLLLKVFQVHAISKYVNDFCYTRAEHAFTGGSNDKPECTWYNYDSGNWQEQDKTPKDYFWIETSSEFDAEYTDLYGKERDCKVLLEDSYEAVNPYVDNDVGLACYIDIEEPVNSVGINTVDWDGDYITAAGDCKLGCYGDIGKWDFELYYQFVPVSD